MDELDTTRGILPHDELRSVRGAIQGNDDLELPFWIVQSQTVSQLLFDPLALIICRDDDADSRLPVLFLYRAPYDAAQHGQRSWIANIDIQDEAQAQPERRSHGSYNLTRVFALMPELALRVSNTNGAFFTISP